jgi:hypothetical protein
MLPAWILDLFAALMLVVAAVSAARIVLAQPWKRGSVVTDSDVSHLFMAIAMAGTLASSLTTLPDGAWEVIFGVLTAWFAYRVVMDARANGVRALAGGHCGPHLVHSAAMLYMFLALAAPAVSGSDMAGMAGMGGASGPATPMLRYPTLALVFALILVGYSVWDLDQLSGRRYRLAGAGAQLAGVVPALADAESANAAFSGAQAAAGSVAAPARPGVAAADRAEPCGGVPEGGTAARGWLLSPGTTVGCRVVMGVTMALVLLIMI